MSSRITRAASFIRGLAEANSPRAPGAPHAESSVGVRIPAKDDVAAIGLLRNVCCGGVCPRGVAPARTMSYSPRPHPCPEPWPLHSRRACGERPFVVDVRDLWPAAAEALGELGNRRVLRAFERAERWLYRNAAAVTATTRPFCRHIDSVAGRPIAWHVPNGALDALVAMPDQPTTPGTAPFASVTSEISGSLRVSTWCSTRPRPSPASRFRSCSSEADRSRPICAGGSSSWASTTSSSVRPSGPTRWASSCCPAMHCWSRCAITHCSPTSSRPSSTTRWPSAGLRSSRRTGEAAAFVAEHGCGVVVAPEDGAALAEVARRLARTRGSQLGSASGEGPRRQPRSLSSGRSAVRTSRGASRLEPRVRASAG